MKAKPILKQLTALFLTAVVSTSLFPSSVFAGEPDIARNNLSEYQAVIDKLNAEYGTDMRFITLREHSDFGIPLPDPRHLGTVEEFERKIRTEIPEELARSAEAEKASKNAALKPGIHSGTLKTTPIIENGKVVGSYWSPSAVVPRSHMSREQRMLAGYQRIIDDLSAEYGLDVRFATEEEIETLGLPRPDVSRLGTLAEYEKNLRAQIEAEIIETEKNLSAYRAALAANGNPEPEVFEMIGSPIYEDGKVIGYGYRSVPASLANDKAVGYCKSNPPLFGSSGPTGYYADKAPFIGRVPFALSASYSVNAVKYSTGWASELSGIISNGDGYWRWTSSSLPAGFWTISLGLVL